MKYNFDSDFLSILDQLPPVDFNDVNKARAEAKGVSGNRARLESADIEVTEQTIYGNEQGEKCLVRIYSPKNKQGKVPAVLHIHGGGYILGDVDSENDFSLEMALQLGAVVVSVDYRLAPEHPYPAALNDCYLALCWVANNVTALGVDRSRIAVFGQSAGGGLAAALCLYSRDNNGPHICFQCLIFPELDDRLETPSAQFEDTPVWYRSNAVLSWEYYLGDTYQRGADDIPYLAAPGRARVQDLIGLPPAYVTAMEFDPLRDEDILYGANLLRAGVTVELHSYPGTFHGSSMIVMNAGVTQRGHKEMLVALARGLNVTLSGKSLMV